MKTPSHLYDQSVDITRATTSLDSGGGVISAYTAHLSSVACRLQQVSARGNIAAGRPASARVYTMFTKAGQDIDMDDQVTFGTRTFKIIEPPSNPDEQSRFMRVVCEELVP